MLFLRRKAEIEVLGATRPSADGIHTDLGMAGRDRSREGCTSGIPLVRYLVAKIQSACAELEGQGREGSMFDS